MSKKFIELMPMVYFFLALLFTMLFFVLLALPMAYSLTEQEKFSICDTIKLHDYNCTLFWNEFIANYTTYINSTSYINTTSFLCNSSNTTVYYFNETIILNNTIKEIINNSCSESILNSSCPSCSCEDTLKEKEWKHAEEMLKIEKGSACPVIPVCDKKYSDSECSLLISQELSKQRPPDVSVAKQPVPGYYYLIAIVLAFLAAFFLYKKFSNRIYKAGSRELPDINLPESHVPKSISPKPKDAEGFKNDGS